MRPYCSSQMDLSLQGQMQGARARCMVGACGHTCFASGLSPLPLAVAVGVLIPSLAKGAVTDPSGDNSLFAAAAAVDLVVFAGVVSCSLPKGVAGGLAGETLSLAGSASMS